MKCKVKTNKKINVQSISTYLTKNTRWNYFSVWFTLSSGKNNYWNSCDCSSYHWYKDDSWEQAKWNTEEISCWMSFCSVFLSHASCRTNISGREAQIDNCCRSHIELQYWKSDNESLQLVNCLIKKIKCTLA